tara:strand:+ start:5986 stop:6240 length:255 start_codon:yes stop_codon:yes gene_type:complete
MSEKKQDLLHAREAETILNSDVFKKAFTSLKEEYLRVWEGSSDQDTNMREKIFMAIKSLNNVEKHLRIMVEKGKITKNQLDKFK